MTGRWRPAAIALLALVTGARKALTGEARLPGRERDREGGTCGLTGGADRSAVSGVVRGRELGRVGRGRGRGAREGAGLETAQPGGRRFFLFLFYFLFLISFYFSISFISFSFEQIIS
jgi:hypothetical protein